MHRPYKYLTRRLEEVDHPLAPMEQDATGILSPSGYPSLLGSLSGDDVTHCLAFMRMVLPDWWLSEAGEVRTPVRYAGDEHEPTGTYRVALQHRSGGRLKRGEAPSLSRALVAAMVRAHEDDAGRARGEGL